jgi:hypothetical protein
MPAATGNKVGSSGQGPVLWELAKQTIPMSICCPSGCCVPSPTPPDGAPSIAPPVTVDGHRIELLRSMPNTPI